MKCMYVCVWMFHSRFSIHMPFVVISSVISGALLWFFYSNLGWLSLCIKTTKSVFKKDPWHGLLPLPEKKKEEDDDEKERKKKETTPKKMCLAHILKYCLNHARQKLALDFMIASNDDAKNAKLKTYSKGKAVSILPIFIYSFRFCLLFRTVTISFPFFRH